VVHEVAGLVGQRVFGVALGYEDLVDHDQLRHDPVMAVLGGKLAARRKDCAPLAGESTLNRLELSREEPTRYHKIGYDAAAIEALFVDHFLDAHAAPPPQITLDIDATDDPLLGARKSAPDRPARNKNLEAAGSPSRADQPRSWFVMRRLSCRSPSRTPASP
jgi:hypothetical protein